MRSLHLSGQRLCGARMHCARVSLPHLAHGPVCLQEVGLEEGVKEVAGDALDGVVQGEHVDALAVLDISALKSHKGKWG